MNLIQVIFLCLIPFVTTSGFASTVYKTVDEQGNVSYSDKLPHNEILLEELEFETVVPTEDPQEHADERIARMASTADRLKKDRLDREASRREDARLDILAGQQSSPPLVVRQDHYVPWFPHHHRLHRKHRKPYIDVNIGHKNDNRHVNFRYRSQPERKRGHVLTPTSKLLTPSPTPSSRR